MIRSSFFGAAGALLAAFSFHVVPAAAAPRLEWTVVPGCPPESAVREAFSRMSSNGDARNAQARATIRREGAAYALDLTLTSQSGTAEMRLTAADCSTLADVVALQLALAADAGAVTANAKTEPAPSPPRLGVSVSTGGAVGPLPGIAAAIRASVSLELAPVRLEAGAKHLFEKTSTYSADPESIGARFDASALFARVCSPYAAGSRSGFGASTCGGLEVGLTRGVGFGTAQTFTSNQGFVAVTAAPMLRYAFPSGTSLYAEGEVGVLLVRPEFHARGLPTLFSPDRAGATVWIGVGQHFE